MNAERRKFEQKFCKEIMRKGNAKGYDFVLKEGTESFSLTTMCPIPKEAYLGKSKKQQAEVTINIMNGYIGIRITADDLNVIDDPYCSQDLETGEPFIVNENRTSLASILSMEKVLMENTELIFEKIKSLESALELNIRHNLIEANREKYRRKQEAMRETRKDTFDEALFDRMKASVEEDMERRLAKCIQKFSGTGFPEELLADFKRTYYRDTKLEFKIEKDDEVKEDKYKEIFSDFFLLGDPVPAMIVTPYALDGYTVGQYIYMWYYSCKGAGVDYSTYCAKYDKDEEARLEETYKRCRTLCEKLQEEAK